MSTTTRGVILFVSPRAKSACMPPTEAPEYARNSHLSLSSSSAVPAVVIHEAPLRQPFFASHFLNISFVLTDAPRVNAGDFAMERPS